MSPCGSKQSGHPVHADRDLLAGPPARDASWPGDDCRNPQPTFQQLCLLARERPGVSETLSAVVAGENNDRVLGQAMRLQRLKNSANLRIHGFDHSLVGLLRSAVEIVETPSAGVAQAFGLRLIPRGLPGPVRRAEMKADHERLAGFRISIDHVNRPAAEHVGQVARLMDRSIVVPKVSLVSFVREIVDSPAAESVEVVIATLQRAKLRQNTQVPLANQSRTVTGLLQ